MATDPTLIYHITHKDNLGRILSNGGLVAQSQISKADLTYCNIAHNSIQDRRSQKSVPCGPGGCLHDYVPFYFAPRSPMLYAIRMGNVTDCTAGQSDIVYLVSSAQRVKAAGIEFVFADGHGIMAFSEFFDDLKDLDAVDWDIMSETYWTDTLEDPDRKRRRQAEFLVCQRFPWTLIEEIAVMDSHVESEVETIILRASHKPPVIIRPAWYY
ncbi:MAG: DUF4433 domain-containing protein [Desulfobacterales bacterium]|nr:DUF4433 domain-containing protein [Desulfobacterales bacterium]